MRSIWVVEDNDANFELVDFLLGEAGHRVARARDDAELAHLLAGPAPDLVLLDMNLPGRSGLEVLATLRSNPALERVPVVALTAHAMRGDRERFLEAGCSGYIPKPIATATFLAAVEGYLSSDERP